MKRWLLLGSLGAALLAGHAHAAEPDCERTDVCRHQTWSGDHALTVPRGRLELGLLQSSRYGLGHHLELALHPLSFFALPHVEVKTTLRAFGSRSWLGLRANVSYPTLFLGLVSRSGSGGLLPEGSRPPAAIQGEIDLITTRAWSGGHLTSVALGLAASAHRSFSPSELPLLDFPFLYQRFAPLYTPVVPRFGVSSEGPLWRKLWYEASVTYYLMPDLPDVGLAYALEPALGLEYRFSDRVAASLALRASQARYAYGSRLHWLPFADVRVAF